MDSTLIRKDASASGNLHDSPCRAPLLQWLRGGGSLCVVTSDDGHRPFAALWEHIPRHLRPQVVLSTSDGAALFRGDAQGDLYEDSSYWGVARGGLPEGSIEPLMELAREMVLEFLVDCLEDRRLLTHLSSRNADALSHFLDSVVEAGGRRALAPLLPMSRLLEPGGVLSHGTMLWRNQAGPIEGWLRDEALCPSAPAVGAPRRDTITFLKSLVTTQPGARYTNVFVMNLPRAISGTYIERFAERLAALGCVASAAPNSICLKCPAASKSLPVEWLAGSLDGAPPALLRLSESVAFGDNPCGNDAPLTTFGGRGMPFVSVGPTTRDAGLPAPLVPLAVGGLEAGTAAVIEALLEARGDGADGGGVVATDGVHGVDDEAATSEAQAPPLWALLEDICKDVRETQQRQTWT